MCCLPIIINILIFGGKHCFLNHPQEYNASDPELQSEDVPPVDRAEDQPEETENNVDSAHEAVEGEHRPVSEG